MAELDELVRRGLRLEREIACHELECLVEDDAPGGKIDAKIQECELIMARQADMARRDALRREYATTEYRCALCGETPQDIQTHMHNVHSGQPGRVVTR